MVIAAVVVTALALTVPADGGQEAAVGAPEVTTKRFRRGETTLVDGFCRVPFEFIEPIPGAVPPTGAYRVQVGVQDSTGTLLHESGWSQPVADRFLGIRGASTVEHFAFTLSPGTYRLTVSVTDSASGTERSASLDVEALYPTAPLSDVLLSGSMRRVSEQSDALGPGELRKGSLAFSASSRPVLTPRSADLYYYLELYPAGEVAAEVAARVQRADGATVTEVAPETVQIGGGGGVVARTLRLAGLPQGSYRLVLTIRFPEQEYVRSADFSMAGFETEEQIAQVVAPAEATPFDELTEARLDSLYSPLVYIMESGERSVYERLSLQGKRNYLREFWAKRDPTPGTSANESREAYYRLFAEASRRFRESGAGDVPGWRTDRGRVYLKYGEPDAVLQRPYAGLTPPYEVWKYTRPRMMKFAFLDETGLGNFALIYTDDRFETSRPGWEALLGQAAVEDVLRF